MLSILSSRLSDSESFDVEFGLKMKGLLGIKGSVIGFKRSVLDIGETVLERLCSETELTRGSNAFNRMADFASELLN